MQVNSITFRPMEVYTTIAVMYFIMLFAASNAMRLLEYRLARVG
jgi:polar amino acid transport system permease protein